MKILGFVLAAMLATIAIVPDSRAAPGLGSINRIDLDGLTETQKADLVKQAESMRTPTNKVAPDDLLEYAQVGAAVGKAIASTARELGVEVNNFIGTPAGKLALLLILWHFFGGMAIHVGAGATFFIIGLAVWLYMWHRMHRSEREYHETGKLSRVVYAMPKEVEGIRVVMLFCMIMLIGITLLVMFTW